MEPIVKKAKQCSEDAGTSEWFIRKLIKENRVKYIRSGRRIYVNWESLVNYLEGEMNDNGDMERK